VTIKITFADEFDAGIAEETRSQLWSTVQEMVQEYGARHDYQIKELVRGAKALLGIGSFESALGLGVTKEPFKWPDN